MSTDLNSLSLGGRSQFIFQTTSKSMETKTGPSFTSTNVYSAHQQEKKLPLQPSMNNTRLTPTPSIEKDKERQGMILGALERGGNDQSDNDGWVSVTPSSRYHSKALAFEESKMQMVKKEKEEKQEKLVAAKNKEGKVSALSHEDKAETIPVIEKVEEKKPPQLTLRYSYSKDQWSPLNPGGKKKYERDFLMELKTEPQSNVKPDNLPDVIAVIQDCNLLRNNKILDIMNDRAQKRGTELSTWQRRLSKINSCISELEEKVQKEMIKAQQTNSSLQELAIEMTGFQRVLEESQRRMREEIDSQYENALANLKAQHQTTISKIREQHAILMTRLEKQARKEEEALTKNYEDMIRTLNSHNNI